MASEIQVYTHFPHQVALGSDLNLDSSNWFWVHCLTIPLKKFCELQLSRRPFKWIRYAIGVVVGAQGDLSSSADSLDIVDYNAGDLPEQSTSLYYHLSDDEKRRMFPLDPTIGRTTDTSSTASTRRVSFNNEVADRDGNSCVLSRLPIKVCAAVHLVAHIKGDEYISNFTRGRSRDPSHGDVIEHIDSVRNGLLLNKITHGVLGEYVAFLPTPNFAMDTADIDPAAITCPSKRSYTTHLFLPGATYLSGGLGAPPSGTPIQMSDSPDWPPAILFDAVYASAVLHHYGTQTLKNVVSSTWDKIFYPSGVVNQAHSDYYTEEWIAKREQKREEALARPDCMDLVCSMPYTLVPPDKLQAYFKKANERAKQEVQRQAQEKVQAWMRQVHLYTSYTANNHAGPVSSNCGMSGPSI